MVLHYTLGFASWLFTIETDGEGAFYGYTHSFASQNYHTRAPRGIAIITYNHYSNGCHKMQYPCEILDIKFSMIFHLQNLLLGLACWDFIYIVLLRSKRISVNFLKIIKPIWAICQKYFFFIEQAMKLWYIFGPIAFLLPPAASNPFSSHMLYHLNSGGVYFEIPQFSGDLFLYGRQHFSKRNHWKFFQGISKKRTTECSKMDV